MEKNVIYVWNTISLTVSTGQPVGQNLWNSYLRKKTWSLHEYITLIQ